MTERRIKGHPEDAMPVGTEDVEVAVCRANEVVGLYGDPDVTWGISLELAFADPLDLSGSSERLRRLVREYPHLGAVPELEEVPVADWYQEREVAASSRLGVAGRLVRIQVDSEGRRLFVTTHHGVADGLGMLAIAEAVVGRPVRSYAKGIGERSARRAFLFACLLRLLEAIFNPPARFNGSAPRASGWAPDSMPQLTTGPRRIDAAVVSHALLQVFRAWPRGRNSGGRRFLVIMGASRRQPGANVPDRQTAYLRIPLRTGCSVDRVRDIMRGTEPEPDFPETSAGGIGPMIIRLLRNRLGCTVNFANLGRIEADGLVSGTIYPALNGPMAVGVGVVSTDVTTTLSVRTRRSDFTPDETERLLARIDAALRSSERPAGGTGPGTGREKTGQKGS